MECREIEREKVQSEADKSIEREMNGRVWHERVQPLGQSLTGGLSMDQHY